MSVQGSAEMQAGIISGRIANLYNDKRLLDESQIDEGYRAILYSLAGKQLKNTGEEGEYHWKRQNVNGLWLRGRAGLRDALSANNELLGRQSVRNIGKALVLLADLEQKRPDSMLPNGEENNPKPDQWRHHIEPRYIVGLHFFDAEEPAEAMRGDLPHWRREAVHSDDPEHYMHADAGNHGRIETIKRIGIVIASEIAIARNSRSIAKRAVA